MIISEIGAESKGFRDFEGCGSPPHPLRVDTAEGIT